MDIKCPTCGATNRGTSRFCARCGSPLPHPEQEAEQGGQAAGTGQPAAGAGVDLPWLQAVQEHAVKQTGQLRNPPPRPPDVSAPQGTPPSSPQETTAPPANQQAAAGTTPAPGEAERPTPTPIPIRQGIVPTPNAQEQGQQATPAQSAATPTEQPATPPPDPNEPPPDWVVGILEPTVTPRTPKGQEYEPEELAHIMPWAYDAPGEPPRPAGEAQDLPPWLRDVTVQETLQSPQVPTQPHPVEDFALEGIEPFVPPPTEDEEAAPQVPERPQEEVPSWLRSISTGQRSAATADAEQQAAQYPPEAETVASPIVVEPMVRNVPVRAPRAGAVDTLEALLQPETLNQPRRAVSGMTAALVAQAEASRRRGITRWLLPDGLIYIAIIAILLAVLLVRPPFGDIPASTSPDVTAFYQQIDQLPASASDKPVLVVYDWDATRSAEMSVLSQAVMRHLMSRHIRFVTISTVAQGPGFAQQVIESVRSDPAAHYGYDSYGTDYLILGYLPGNEAALRSAVDNFSVVLPLDYQRGQRLDSYPVLQSGKVKGAQDFGLVIDLASDEAELRNWIEQVGARTQVPIIAAVPQSLEPLARTYRGVPGTGLKALISGTTGALAYSRQLISANRNVGSFDSNALTDRLNAQSVAQLLVAVVILAALIGMATRRILRR